VRSRRNTYLFLVVAVVAGVVALAVDPGWARLLAGVLALGAGGLVATTLVLRQQDPNGPPGQH
jgi:hypothetical protein